MIIIFTTATNRKQAVEIGDKLLREKTIACYNLVPIQSKYWWKGKTVEDNEILMLIKTRKENFRRVEKTILENSIYETPEVIAIKPSKVNNKYLDWLNALIDKS